MHESALQHGRECSLIRQRVLFGLAKRSLHHGRVIFNLGESVLSMVEGALRHGNKRVFLLNMVECSLSWKKMPNNMAKVLFSMEEMLLSTEENACHHGRPCLFQN